MITAVHNMVQDPGIADDDVLTKLNEALLVITAAVKQPDLDTSATVTTELDSNAIDLPADYHHGLYAAWQLKRPVTVYGSRANLLRVYDASVTGTVCGVCAKGTELMYLPIPTAATDLTIYYFARPEIMTDGTAPTCFTAKAQVYAEAAMRHYAAKELWSEIEDGLEGAKANTMFHEAKFIELLGKVERYTDGISNPPPPVTRCAW